MTDNEPKNPAEWRSHWTERRKVVEESRRAAGLPPISGLLGPLMLSPEERAAIAPTASELAEESRRKANERKQARATKPFSEWDPAAIFEYAAEHYYAELAKRQREQDTKEFVENLRPTLLRDLGSLYKEAEPSERTHKSYLNDYARFIAYWKEANEILGTEIGRDMPVPAEAVAFFVVANTQDQTMSCAAIARIVTSVGYCHRLAGQYSPIDEQIVKASLIYARKHAATKSTSADDSDDAEQMPPPAPASNETVMSLAPKDDGRKIGDE